MCRYAYLQYCQIWYDATFAQYIELQVNKGLSSTVKIVTRYFLRFVHNMFVSFLITYLKKGMIVSRYSVYIQMSLDFLINMINMEFFGKQFKYYQWCSDALSNLWFEFDWDANLQIMNETIRNSDNILMWYILIIKTQHKGGVTFHTWFSKYRLQMTLGDTNFRPSSWTCITSSGSKYRHFNK